MLVVAATTAKMFLSQPAVAAQHTATGAVLVALLNGLLSLGLSWLLLNSLDPASEEGMVAQFEKLGGVFGTLVSAVMAAYFLGTVSWQTRQMGGLIINSMLPFTPITVVEGTTVMAFAYASALGLETISRAAMILLLPIVTVILVLLLLTAPRFDFSRLFPPLGFGWRSLLYWSLFSGWYREAWVAAVLFPYLRRREEGVGVAVEAIALSTGLLTLVTAALLALFGYPLLARLPAPAQEGSRAIYLGPFVTNLEAVFVFILTTALFLMLSVMFWAGCILVADLLKLSEYRPLVPLLAAGVWLGSYLPPSLMVTVHWSGEELREVSSFVLYPGVVTLWCLRQWRRRRERRRGA